MLAGNAVAAAGAALPDSTWVALKALPHQGRAPVFALAVDPANDQALLAANSAGTLLRSTDGGASWSTVRTSHAEWTTIAFSPFKAGLVLAGTRGGGAAVSRDGGATWAGASGLDGRAVHVFAFAAGEIYAGTDRGVYASQDGSSWSAAGLEGHGVGALAVEAVHSPVRLVAAPDSAAGTLTLYQSADGGTTWSGSAPALSGTLTVELVAGPLPPSGNVRPLIAGTNSGLFASNDNGSTFTPLSGGSLLPTTDYTEIAFVTNHYERFYAGSDGGGSGSGGLWRSDDGGGSFTSLSPPEPSVTALTVANEENPRLYVATFDPTTHVASLWAYRDTRGTPQGPATSPTAAASGARQGTAASPSQGAGLLSSTDLPYVGLGLGALAVIMAALVANARSRSR